MWQDRTGVVTFGGTLCLNGSNDRLFNHADIQEAKRTIGAASDSNNTVLSLQFSNDFEPFFLIESAIKPMLLKRQGEKFCRVRIAEYRASCHELLKLILTSCSATRIDLLEIARVSVLDDDLNRVLEENLGRAHIKAVSLLNVVIPASTTMALIKGCAMSETIREIHLTNSQFENALLLADGMRQWRHIQKLDFFSCSLSDTQASKIITSTKDYLPCLTHLDLADNHCGAQSLQTLNSLLTTSNSLETLNLALQRDASMAGSESDDNSEDDTSDQATTSGWGISAIKTGLIQNQSLRTLYLRGNVLDDAGVECLIECLLANTTLQKLMLTDCQLSYKASQSLLKALANMTGLTCLWLDGQQSVQLSSKRKELLTTCTQSLRQNTSLWELHLPFSLRDESLRKELYGLLDLNQAGRKYVLSSQDLSTNLWSLVLARVNTMQFSLGKRGNEKLALRRLNVLYAFLRQKFLLEI